MNQETLEFASADSPIDAIVQINGRANKVYPQMTGPITLITSDAFLGYLVDNKTTAREFMSHRHSAATLPRQLDLANRAHAAYGQYKLSTDRITYTWERNKYDTLRALQLFIPKSYARNEKKSIAYIDNPKNRELMQRVFNLFKAGSQALEGKKPLEKAQLYRETLRDFVIRKYDKQHPWTDEEKEGLQQEWGIFSDYLRDMLSTAIMDSNSKLDKPFNEKITMSFLQEVANRGTRVQARFKNFMP